MDMDLLGVDLYDPTLGNAVFRIKACLFLEVLRAAAAEGDFATIMRLAVISPGSHLAMFGNISRRALAPGWRQMHCP